MKKKPVSISDGKLKSYEDPLRRLAPIDKERGDRVEPEKDTGENEILKREKQEKKFSKDDMIYIERRAFRIKSFLISIVLGAVAYHVYFLSPVFAPLANYFFLRMFFLGIGRSIQKQRRLKASRVILYTVILGLQLVSIFGELISYYTNNEEMLGLYFVVAIVLWLLAIVIAVFNKIQVNVHNQD